MTEEIKVSHTPGPWKVRFFSEDIHDGFFVEAPKTNPDAAYDIEILSDDSGHYPTEQKLADAKLIAAAPELLRACQECVKVFDEAGIDAPFLTGAIKKAIE